MGEIRNSSFESRQIFKKLKDYFEENIKFSLKTEDKLFVVTKSDIFYQINIYDENIDKFVSENDKTIIDNMIVKELCSKKIIDLNYGFFHYFAKSEDNRIYCWGTDYFLGNTSGKDESTFLNKPILNQTLSDLNINILKCGALHSLALTTNGDVYQWGWNGVGRFQIMENDFHYLPVKVNNFENEVIIMISCGYTHSMALTKNGNVYSWGNNKYGQIGIGNKEDSDTPKLIKLDNVFISKISCSQFNSFLLSSDGVIYTVRNNYSEQHRLGIEKLKSKPTKLTHEKTFIDIASHWHDDIMVALSSDKIYHLWVVDNNDLTWKLKATYLKSFNEIFSRLLDHDLEVNENLTEFTDLYFRDGHYKRVYKEIEKLGEGGYGEVFKVIDLTRCIYGDKNYHIIEYQAVKKISFERKLINDIRREVYRYSFIHKLANFNVATHFNAWLENDTTRSNRMILYIVMEYCEKTLENLINEIRTNVNFEKENTLTPLGFYLASQIFIEILESVQYLHNNKIIHRDLYPSNIMLNSDKNTFIRIVDFGLMAIKEFADQTHFSKSGKGNIDYVAPEVFNGEEYDTKADIYSLGKILSELFDIDNQKQIIDSKYKKIIELSERMTEEDPHQRPNCEEILKEKNLWALDYNDFDLLDKCKNIFKLDNKEIPNFTYFLLEHKIKDYINATMEENKVDKKLFIMNNLLNFKHNPPIVLCCLMNLYQNIPEYIKPSIDLVKITVEMMVNHPKSASIQLNGIKCLINFTRKEFEEKIPPKIIGNAINVTLKSIKLFPDNQEIYENMLYFLHNEHIIEDVSFNRYECLQLIMNSLNNFSDTGIHPRALYLCTQLPLKISIEEKLNLCTNPTLVLRLEEMLINHFKSYPIEYEVAGMTLQILLILCIDLLDKIDKKIIKNMIDIALILMDCFQNHESIITIGLSILCKNENLQEVSFDRFKCIEILMNSLVNFMDEIVERMALFLFSQLIRNFSYQMKADFFSNPENLRKLLDIFKKQLHNESIELRENLLEVIGEETIRNIHKTSRYLKNEPIITISEQLLDLIRRR